MSWQPQGFDQPGWQPDGWSPDGVSSAPPIAISRLRLVRARPYLGIVRKLRLSSADLERGAPYEIVPAKRSFDTPNVGIDWHDYLINRRVPGGLIAADFCFRFERRDPLNRGLQFRCTSAGVASGAHNQDLRWPSAAGKSITDGQVVWTAEAIADSSLRTTISTSTWPIVAGLTLSSPVNIDQAYQTVVSGGLNGTTYEIKHQVGLADGTSKEGVIVLPVED